MNQLKWVTLQEFAKVVRRSEQATETIPERTLRHMASQNKFRTEKRGKQWFVCPATAIAAGLYVPLNVQESWRMSEQPASVSTEDVKPKTTSVSEEKKTLKKKYKAHADLGVYSELLALFIKEKSNFCEGTRHHIKQTLYHLGAGYYEYGAVNKSKKFGLARDHLSCALVEDDVEGSGPSAWREITDKVMAGIGGLIKKHEERNWNAEQKKRRKDER